MGIFELELNDEHLISLGKITVNFATLEQVMSMFIWSIIELEPSVCGLRSRTAKIGAEPMVEFYISARYGIDKSLGNKLGQIITAELSFRQKVDLLSSLYKNKRNNSTELAELDALLSRVAQAEQERNTAVHSFWIPCTIDGREIVARIKPTAKRKTKGMNLRFKSVSVKDLEDVAKYIAEVAYDVQSLLVRFCESEYRKQMKSSASLDDNPV